MGEPHAHEHGPMAQRSDRRHDPRDSAAASDARATHEANLRRLLTVIIFGATVLVGEVIAGLIANSLVLLSDAAHMFTDVAAVGLAYFAARLSMRPPDAAKSYGYYRAETVAAFVNALALWAIAAYLIYEALSRLQDPPAVQGGLVAIVGGLTLAGNLVMAGFLHAGRANLNVRSAYVHVLADALGSLAAVIAGLGILLFDALWLDAAATLVVSVLLIGWTWRLTRESLHILLEGTPASVRVDDVRATIADTPGVENVHDLHVWSLTTGVDNLSAHVRVGEAGDGPTIVRAIRERLGAHHRLAHITIEVETDASDCIGCN